MKRNVSFTGKFSPNTLQKEKKVKMIKQLFFVGLATAALGAATLPALAQVDISGQVTTIQTNAAHPLGANQGLFAVSADEVGNTDVYNILVSYLSTYGGAAPVPAYIDEVQVNLLGTGGIVGGSGAVNGTAYNTILLGGPILFKDPGAAVAGRVTAPAGTQFFAGQVTVAGPFAATGASFTLSTLNGVDGSGSGNFTPSTTPEGASLLLLLPGLIPVAVGLRRRRQNKLTGE